MKVWASTLLLGLRFFTSIVEAELDKPGLLESGDLDKFEPGLKASLPKVSIKETVTWSPGWIFPDCKNFADIYNFSVADIETIEVYYDDCDSPWVCFPKSGMRNPRRKNIIGSLTNRRC